MRLVPLLLLGLVAWLGVGCGAFEPKARNAKADQFLLDDGEERKERLRASQTLSPQEYAALAKKMGWTEKSKSGLPPALTIEELEKRVHEAGPKP